MKAREVALSSYVDVYGKPQTALAMGITRQRVQQMISNETEVYLRVDPPGKVVGWYIYRDVAG